MDSLEQWLNSQSVLSKAINDFLAKSSDLYENGLVADLAVSATVVSQVSSRVSELETLHHSNQEALVLTKRFLNNAWNRAPVNTLPFEVLARIFELTAVPFCYFDRDLSYSQDREGKHDRLIDLSSVCSLWRKIMLQCGWLWAHVDMTLNSQKGSYQAFCPGILWLERSNGYPLHIHYEAIDEEHSFYNPVSDILRPYAKQISTITFGPSSESSVIQDILKVLHQHGDINSVTVLEIQVPKFGEGSTNRTPLPDCFRRLVRLDLRQCGQMGWSVYQLATVLSNDPCLRTVSLRTIFTRFEKHDTFPMINLPELRYFDLRGASEHVVEIILPLISPITRRIHFGVDVYHRAPTVASITSFLSRSFVTSLVLSQGQPDFPGPLTPYILAARNIQTLFATPCTEKTADRSLIELKTLAEQDAFPSLEALYLVDRKIGKNQQDEIESLLRKLALDKLGLINCGFRSVGSCWQDESAEEKKTFIAHVSCRVAKVVDLKVYDGFNSNWEKFVQNEVFGRAI
ncbi:pyrolysin [Ceratobasidium sp. AG-Ba]|nr:pyrolysin [Ceratobasidium sp. AG-Ba]